MPKNYVEKYSMLKIYDFLFYRQYKLIASVNKISPKNSAIIYFSTLISFNIMSILILFKNLIETIGLNGGYILITLIMVINFWRYNKNYKTIVAEFGKMKVKRVWSYLALLHPYISFFILFKVLGIEYLTIGIALGIMIIIDVVACYMYSEEENPKEY